MTSRDDAAGHPGPHHRSTRAGIPAPITCDQFLYRQQVKRINMSGIHLELMRDPTHTFPHVADPESVHSARIWHCKYRSLAPLANLRNLEELVIATCPDESLEFLGSLEKLRLLYILHLPKISDIAPLAKLSQLTSLSLSTLPSWDASKKVTVIQSLEPLAAMPQLVHLELFGVRPPDKSLRPLWNCNHLRTARLSQYPRAEMDRFFAERSVLCEFNPKPSFS